MRKKHTIILNKQYCKFTKNLSVAQLFSIYFLNFNSTSELIIIVGWKNFGWGGGWGIGGNGVYLYDAITFLKKSGLCINLEIRKSATSR